MWDTRAGSVEHHVRNHLAYRVCHHRVPRTLTQSTTDGVLAFYVQTLYSYATRDSRIPVAATIRKSETAHRNAFNVAVVTMRP